LEGDANVQALCALLGRAWQHERSSKLEKVQKQVTFQTLLPDVHSREELVGIEFGKNVSRAVAAEWMLLADSASETLFDLKLAESRLLCFRMEGMQTVTQDREEEHSVEDRTRGPIIVCVDTSGSMQGAPEHVAKAMALFLALQTQAEGRDCYLINFSTDIDVLDLSDQFGMATLMRFLQMSFHGGTDAAPALDHALEMLRSEHYERADVLVISDFVMAELSPDTLSAIAAQRAHENRFYSLCIGARFPLSRVRDHFDREWMFEPARSSIVELFRLRDDMGTRAC
jgi:uncharacterized protein with von Willebrand factor type A (vWA) domain